MSRRRLPFAERPYRLGVGIVMLSVTGRVFVARRIDTTAEAWQMPQGGIDGDESPRDACLRELKEETGTDKADIIAESREWLSYDLPEDIADKVWKGRFRGQSQKWFCLRFIGEDSDIDIKTAHPEFEDWKWVDYETLPDLIVPFKRPLYEQVVAEFRYLAG